MLAFDINLCCSGYVYGLHTAMLHMQTGYLKKVLLLVGDTASYTCSPEDRGQMMLFGDAVINTERLIVPHYDLLNRAFMLVPLLAIAPDARLPDGRALRSLLASLDSSSIVLWHG